MNSKLLFLFFLLLLPTPYIVAQQLKVSELAFNPGRNQSFISLMSNGQMIFNTSLPAQPKLNYGLMGIAYIGDTFIIAQMSNDAQSTYLNYISSKGERQTDFSIQWPERELSTLGTRPWSFAADADKNVYVKFIGKNPKEQYGVEYLRKYDSIGELLWERVADDASDLKWFDKLLSFPNGVFADYSEGLINQGHFFSESEEPTMVYSFSMAKEGKVVRVNGFGIKYENYRIVTGSDGGRYYINALKESKGSFSFYLTDMLEGREMKLDLQDVKPDPQFYAVIDNAGKTILSYKTVLKKKISNSKKKVKVYKHVLALFSANGQLIEKKVLLEDSEVEIPLIRPIYALDGKLVALVNNEILLSDYTLNEEYDRYPIGPDQMSNDMMKYGLRVNTFVKGSPSFFFQLDKHRFVLIELL